MIPEFRPWSGLLGDARRIKSYHRYFQGWEEKIGSFLQTRLDSPPVAEDSHAERKLEDVPFAVKDNIAVEDFQLSCGSKILEGFRSPYSATCVRKLLDEGAIVVGKTNLDEFGMGSSTENSALAETSNPWDRARVPGGSSGGSAAAVAAGLVPFALGTDTGGSVRQPAAFCGIYGLKPSYGAVSRFGLVAYASSLECPGILARSVEAVEEVYGIIRGEDTRDQRTCEPPPAPAKTEKSERMAVISGIKDLDVSVESAYRRTINEAGNLGYEILELDMPSLEYVLPAYYTIASAEASANLARFTGIAYGKRTDWAENPEDLIRKSRSEGFGAETKLRILLGTYVLRSGFQSRYYLKAQKIRAAIADAFREAFKKAPLILMPVFPVQAFLKGDSGMDQFAQKLADKFTCAANIAGLPSLAFPTENENGLPVGMQILAPAFAEASLFEAARKLRQAFPVLAPEGFSQEFLS